MAAGTKVRADGEVPRDWDVRGFIPSAVALWPVVARAKRHTTSATSIAGWGA
jgi:hypothetical protein